MPSTYVYIAMWTYVYIMAEVMQYTCITEKLTLRLHDY